MKVNIRRGLNRIAILVLIAWWITCLYLFADTCWLPAGPERFTSFGMCGLADVVDLIVGTIVIPLVLLIIFVIANLVVNWLIDGFAPKK